MLSRRDLLMGVGAGMIGHVDERHFLPLSDRAYPFVKWERFCLDNRWAGADPAVPTMGAEGWIETAERVNSVVNRSEHRPGAWFPQTMPSLGDPVNCIGATVLKLWMLIDQEGFPSSNARVIIVERTSRDQPDHGAALLRFADGDYILDNRAPGARAGLHHWTRLIRRPLYISEGNRLYRAVRMEGVWSPTA